MKIVCTKEELRSMIWHCVNTTKCSACALCGVCGGNTSNGEFVTKSAVVTDPGTLEEICNAED